MPNAALAALYQNFQTLYQSLVIATAREVPVLVIAEMARVLNVAAGRVGEVVWAFALGFE